MTETRRDLAEILGQVVRSDPIGDHDGRSGARIERAVLADGTAVVIKRVTRDEDLVMLATDDHEGREARLWANGVFDRLPRGVSHAVLAAGRHRGELVTVMSDLTGAVLTWDRVLSGAELGAVFGAGAALHAAFAGAAPDGVCPLARRLPLLAPGRMGRLAGAADSLPALIVRGWERFAELLPPEVVTEVFASHEDPGRVIRGLSGPPTTLLHGDFSLINLAPRADDVVLLDWTLATAGPGVLDFVVFIATSASQVDLPYVELVHMARRACGEWHDENVLRVALFWGLSEMGWNKALDATSHPDPAKRAAERAELDWWTEQGRAALDAGLIG